MRRGLVVKVKDQACISINEWCWEPRFLTISETGDITIGNKEIPWSAFVFDVYLTNLTQSRKYLLLYKSPLPFNPTSRLLLIGTISPPG